MISAKPQLLPAHAVITMGKVETDLFRAKDQRSEERRRTAQLVANNLEKQLGAILPLRSDHGGESTSERNCVLSLNVIVKVASGGSRRVGMSSALGRGSAKLVIYWTLCDDRGNIFLSEGRAYTGGESTLAVRDSFRSNVGSLKLEMYADRFVRDLSDYLDHWIVLSSEARETLNGIAVRTGRRGA